MVGQRTWPESASVLLNSGIIIFGTARPEAFGLDWLVFPFDTPLVWIGGRLLRTGLAGGVLRTGLFGFAPGALRAAEGEVLRAC
jgi:hypothetical protein